MNRPTDGKPFDGMPTDDNSSAAASPPRPDSRGGLVTPDIALPYLGRRAREGKLAILVGSRASALAGLDLWTQLGNRLRLALGKKALGDQEASGDNVLQLASMYVDAQHKSLLDRSAAKNRLIRLIEELLYSPRPTATEPFGSLYPLLCDLPVANFYTTNWDHLFYQCLIQAGTPRVERFDHHTVRYHPEPAPVGHRHLVHLHGTIPGDPDQTLATSDECYEFSILAEAAYERLVRQFRSRTTLLAIGYSLGELDVLTYLGQAREQGDPTSPPIYALLPPISLHAAKSLFEGQGIATIATPAPPRATPAAIDIAFLEALRGHARGESPQISIAQPQPSQEGDKTHQGLDGASTAKPSTVEDILRAVERRMFTIGFRTPADFFTNWQGRDALDPVLPPSHPLLETVYVERGLKASLLEDIERGQPAGISGLLGLGGVGKSFLAMKIAQELSREGWAVVWVGLLDQNAEDALHTLASAYGLRYAEHLRLDEKVVALKILFEEVVRGGRRTLVILDNAERFPDLPLLLEALEQVPTLITSRTEECNDIVRYRRIESMTGAQAEELCRLYLNEHGDGHYDRLREADREDLRRLCRHLGGHPLGIRLVLAGFVRRLAHRRFEERPFRTIAGEIRRQGLEAIPPGRELGGRAGQMLHRTIFTTFEWLYRDLPELSPEFGLQARQLLPLVAALGSVEISRRSITTALAHLRRRIATTLDPSKAMAEQQRQFQTSVAAAGVRPSGLTVGSFGVRRLTSPQPRIEIPAHRLKFDEEKFLTLLGGSISLTRQEKRRIILAISRFSQYQVDELTKILEEEKRKFSQLDIRHEGPLRALEAKHAEEWEQLGREMAVSSPAEVEDLEAEPPRRTSEPPPENPPQEGPDGATAERTETGPSSTKVNPLSDILDPNPPHDLVPHPPAAPSTAAVEKKNHPTWFTALASLADEAVLEETLTLLISVSLVDPAEAEGAVGVHPLVREFAFEERNQAHDAPADEAGQSQESPLITASGPALEAIFESALAVLSPSEEHGDSFLDLLPRLASRRSLAEQACQKILAGTALLDKLGQWELLRQLYEEGTALAAEAGLEEKEGLLRCKLGELLHRMEYAQGIPILRRGIELLEEHGSSQSEYALEWARAYYSLSACEIGMECHVLESLASLRAVASSRNSINHFDIINVMEFHLRQHLGEGARSSQMGLASSKNNWLDNATLDLGRWFALRLDHGLELETLQDFQDLYGHACARAEDSQSAQVAVLPERRVYSQIDLLFGHDLLNSLPNEALEHAFQEIRGLAHKAGIRGIALLRSYHYHRWRRCLLAGQWQEALPEAEQYLALTEEGTPSNRAYNQLGPRLTLAISCLLEQGAKELDEMRGELEQIEERCREWGRNDLLGWLLLAQALLTIRSPEPGRRKAAAALVQARRAFQRQRGAVPPEAEAVYRRASELIDAGGAPLFEALRDTLAEEEKTPPDYCPWLVRRREPLPERVRSKRDGRRMRLVRGGLQMGPHGRECWLYPFYVDEEPVGVESFQGYLGDQGIAGQSLTGEGENAQPGQTQGPWAAGMTPATARDYARWAGKQLPNPYEWFATQWQVAAGHSPEVWEDWQTTSERMLERIRVAIHGEVWDRQPLLPGQSRALPTDVPPSWLRQEIDDILGGSWLLEDPALAASLHRLSKRLAAAETTDEKTTPEASGGLTEPGLSKPEAERLIRRLAAMPLPLDDKLKILCKTDLTSEEARKLREALVQDLQNLDGRDAYHRVTSAQNVFLRWLTGRRPGLDHEGMRHFLSAGWILRHPELEKLFERRVVEPLASHPSDLSDEEARELAIALACSLTLKHEEKVSILQRLDELSQYQVREILTVLRSERQRLLDTGAQQPEKLGPSTTRVANEFSRWLLEDPGRLPFFRQPRLDGTWAGVEPLDSPLPWIGPGDPLVERLWIAPGMVTLDSIDFRRVGIRCVLPIFTTRDLEELEEI